MPAQVNLRSNVDRTAAARWGWLTLIALVPALAATIVLASMLTERLRPPPTEPAAVVDADATKRTPHATAEAPGAADNATEVAPAATARAVGEASARPKPYSTIDTETLAAARAYPNAVTPELVAQPVASPSAPRDGEASTPAAPAELTTRAQRTFDRSASAKPSARGATRPPAPAAIETARREVRREPRAANAMAMTSAVSPQREPAGERASPSAVPASPTVAAGAQLDVAWERRERWLRERLQERQRLTQ